MVESVLTAPHSSNEPSPWWLKGGAIFIGFLGFSSLIGAISLAASGFWINTMEDTWEPEEICKDDPEKDECIKVFESLNEIAEMNLWDVGAAFSALLFLLSIPTALLMWTAEDRDAALKLAWGWVFIHAASQLYITHEYMSWMNDFYDSIPEDLGWVEIFNRIAGYGSVIFCELTLAAGLAMISYQTRPQTTIEISSAFHKEASMEEE